MIASLNGTTAEAWLRYSGTEQAGADGLEVNLYEVVADLSVPGVAVETQMVDAVLELKQSLRIPVAIKLSPYFSAFGNVASRLDQAGADALVMLIASISRTSTRARCPRSRRSNCREAPSCCCAFAGWRFFTVVSGRRLPQQAVSRSGTTA